MTKIYRSAMGKSVDIDNILLKNETVIAVGNMKVNARGDELGPGGRIVKTRDQIMKEYYALNTPVAVDPMDTMQPDDPPATKPMLVSAPVTPPVVQTPAPVVENTLVYIDPNSGLDDDDDGPAVVAIPQMSVEEVLKQPYAAAIPVPTPSVVPTAKVEPLQADVATPVKITVDTTPAPKLALRGSLADSVAKTTTVTQTEKLPINKANGVQRF